MGSFLFLQPWFLFGLLAASLPLIIHLIHRQRRKRILFSTLRFLLQTDRRSARKYRLVDYLVLLLRTLLLLFLALALSQPVVRPPGASGVEFGKLSVGIVIDDSMSMQRVADGVRLFDRALQDAQTILTEIPQDGEAFVLFSSGNTPPALTVPASPPDSLANPVGDQNCSFSGSPLAKAVDLAVDTLAGSKNRHRALVIIGDLQARSLGQSEIVDFEKLQKEVRSVQILEIQGKETNLAVEDITASPRVCFSGTPVRVRARLASSFDEPVEAKVSLWIDNQKVQGETVELPARATGEVVFTHVLNDPGPHRASVRLEPDGLAADNSRYAALRVLRPIKALLIAPGPAARIAAASAASGDSSAAAVKPTDETIFLHTALDPLRTPNFSGQAPVQVSRASYEAARSANLSRFGFLFIVDSGNITDRLLNSIRDYVRGGGHALFFPGRGLMPEAGRGQALKGQRFAWLQLRGGWKRNPEDKPTGFGELDRRHPIFALLNRSAPELFNTVAVQAYLDVDETRLGPSDTVIARYESGAPLLVESTDGAGFLLAWTTGCHPDWGDLPLRPLFLPLLYESLKHAGGARETRIRGGLLDGGFTMQVQPSPESRAAEVALPSGRRISLTVPAESDIFEFQEAEQPGFYQLEILGENEGPVQVALNVDPAESRLERVSPEALDSFFPDSVSVQIEESASKAAQRLSYSSKGYSLSGWLLALALLAFLGEIYLSNTLLRHESDRPAWVKRLQAKFKEESGGI